MDYQADWQPLFRAQADRLQKILAQVEQERAHATVYPPREQVFRAFQLASRSSVRVVILGQDPYHQPGQAHGLSFSVPPGIKPPPSLQNIYKALQHDDPDFVIPAHGCLEAWVRQGVLLLNSVLTVRRGAAGSHRHLGWQAFTRAVLAELNAGPPTVFLLWGRFAQEAGKDLDSQKHLLLHSVHPSPLSAYRGFLTCGHFARANSWLREQGRAPVNWQLPPADEAQVNVKKM